MRPEKKSSARLLAPLALAVCAIAVFTVLVGSAGDDDPVTSAPVVQDSAPTSDTETESTSGGQAPGATYTVETGDTLGAIAVEKGVPVDTLLELNPGLDPQALTTGQKIKLAE